jgi:hypothetical protein
MSLRAQRGNRTEAWPPCIACDCRVAPLTHSCAAPRNDMDFINPKSKAGKGPAKKRAREYGLWGEAFFCLMFGYFASKVK